MAFKEAKIMNLLKLLFGIKERKSVTVATRKVVAESWSQVQIMMASKNPSSLKQAVITCDKLLDSVLKDLVAGETLGERLKNAKDLFSSYQIYQTAWEAHKVRNSLVHEANYDPPYYVCNDAVNRFNEVLRDLGAL